MERRDQVGLVEGAVARIRELNVARDDDFQDKAMGELVLAYDSFRPPLHERQPGIEPEERTFEHDLPATGEDALLDALREIARELDASQEAVAERCDRALALTREESSPSAISGG